MHMHWLLACFVQNRFPNWTCKSCLAWFEVIWLSYVYLIIPYYTVVVPLSSLILVASNVIRSMSLTRIDSRHVKPCQAMSSLGFLTVEPTPVHRAMVCNILRHVGKGLKWLIDADWRNPPWKIGGILRSGSGSMMGIDSPEEPMVTDRRGIVLISFQSIAEPSNHKPVLYI